MGRKIEKELVAFIDEKLKGNGLAQEALAKKDARLLFRLAAQACVGIREEGGQNRGKWVEIILDTVGSPHPGAWCMAFVQSMLGYAEVKTGKKSPIYASESCSNTWSRTPVEQRVKKLPAPGAIVIWKHFPGPGGHTGVVESANKKTFTAFEGNTGKGVDESGEVVREGDGVYHTKRSMSGNGDMKITGFLKPF